MITRIQLYECVSEYNKHRCCLAEDSKIKTFVIPVQTNVLCRIKLLSNVKQVKRVAHLYSASCRGDSCLSQLSLES